MFRDLLRGSSREPVEISDEDIDNFQDDLDPEDRALEDAELLADIARREAEEARLSAPRPMGPWDDLDAPTDEVPRIDLGSLRVPVPPDTEVRVDVSPEGEVVAATLVLGESSLQVNAFAAPRTEGIWAEVRSEIAEALRGGGGRAEEQDGPFGPELAAQVPADQPGATAMTPARFLGVDGPRWFLRALITGPAAVDSAAATDLEAALREVVVRRGTDPMAVRDPLPLRLPRDVAEQAEAAQAAEQAGAGAGEQPSLQLPERGPEITEVR